MKELRDLNDSTTHDVQSISDEETTGSENYGFGLDGRVGGRAARSHYRGTSLIRNSPPPKDHPRTLGIVLL